MKIVAGDEPKL